MSTDTQNAIEKLYSLQRFGVKLGLENISRFLKLLGSPEQSLKVFHLAGSNGKGSTAAFLASILQESGADTGLYTSPHFVRFNERIKINGKEIDDFYIADFFSKHENYIFENKLTFFEVTTAIAFQYFADNEVDYAVIEAGLGGRLDATNTVDPLAVLITSVSKEHTNILGNNLSDIASEKAAIIKPETKVFTGILPGDAAEVITKRCKKLNCDLFRIEDFTLKRDESFELYTEDLNIDDINPPLHGIFQKFNAAMATLAVNKTLHISDPNVLRKGIKNVITNTGIEGRYEIANKKPRLIFDTAHNLESAVNFLNEFRNDKTCYRNKMLLFSALKDKPIDLILRELGPFFNRILITEMKNERAANFQQLAEAAKFAKTKPVFIQDYVEFVKHYLSRSRDDCLVVLGSFYLIGEIKKQLNL